MPNKQKKFQQIIDVSMEIAQAKDLDFLLQKILSTVKNLASADAGSIYIMHDGQLHFHHAQNGVAQNAAVNRPQFYDTPSASGNLSSIAAYVARSKEILNLNEVSDLSEHAPYKFDPAIEGHACSKPVHALLAFPLKTNNGQVVGVIQLLNPRNEEGEISTLSEDDTPLLQLFANNAANAVERAQTTRARVLGIIQILTALRDTEETVAHVNRVGAYAAEIYDTWARKKELPEEAIAGQKDILRMAAMLHDLGKLAIPTVIRRKPGKLSEDEYETMKEHTIKGAQLLVKHATSEIEEVAAQIALTHHERWDGKGYPGYLDPATGKAIPGYENKDGKARGKKGTEIPVFGRIVAIADVYDALSNHRVFREAWKEEDVLNKLKAEAGTHFDPDMITAFFESLETIRAISKRFADQLPATDAPSPPAAGQ